MKQSRKSPLKTKTGSDKKEVSIAKIGLISAVTVAIVGLFGTAINAYFSSQAAQAPILIPIQATQTAEAKIITLTAELMSPAPMSDPPAVPTSRSTPIASGMPAPTVQFNACPTALDFGALIRCDISSQGEVHLFTFAATQDEYSYIRVMNEDAGGMFSPRITIYDPSGNKFIEDYSNEGAERVIRAISSGDYIIRIEDGERTHTGRFALYLQHLPDPTSAQNITAGVQLRDSFSTAYQQNVYRFDAVAGGKVSIEVSEIPAAGPLSLRVVIYDPNGNQEYYSFNDSDIIAHFTAPSSGVYVMFVSNPSIAGTGEYFVFRQ